MPAKGCLGRRFASVLFSRQSSGSPRPLGWGPGGNFLGIVLVGCLVRAGGQTPAYFCQLCCEHCYLSLLAAVLPGSLIHLGSRVLNKQMFAGRPACPLTGCTVDPGTPYQQRSPQSGEGTPRHILSLVLLHSCFTARTWHGRFCAWMRHTHTHMRAMPAKGVSPRGCSAKGSHWPLALALFASGDSRRSLAAYNAAIALCEQWQQAGTPLVPRRFLFFFFFLPRLKILLFFPSTEGLLTPFN